MRRYTPDFLIQISGKMLVLEINGGDSDDKAKRAAPETWMAAINADGGFGVWCWGVAFEMSRINDILIRDSGGSAASSHLEHA